MIFNLDPKSRVPIYEQLCQSVMRMAALGVLEPETPLPSVRALAQELGINPNTVQKAYHILEHDGIIVSIPGKGSFLSGEETAVLQHRRQLLDTLQGTIREAQKLGVKKEELQKLLDACYNERGNPHD